MTVVPSSWMRSDRMTGGNFDTTKIRNKAPFMAKVFALLIIQLAITFFVMEKMAKNDTFLAFAKKYPIFPWFIFLFPFVVILALAFLPLPMYGKLVLFTLFSICFGFLLSISRRMLSPELMRMVLVITMGIFVSMFIVGMLLAGLGYDLFWLGAILFVLLLIALIAGIVMLFTHPEEKTIRTRAILVVILFSVYIIYDTNQIIMRDYLGDYVTAGIDYYLDFLNVFVHLIEVFANNQ